MSNTTVAKIEALLFALGRPLSRAELQKHLGISTEDIEEALRSLAREPRGITLVDDGKTLELRVSADAAPLVERVRKEEYSRDIGKAGLEALSAILYRGPLTRAEIDFIRGVNSTQTLRTLTMRGLVRKIPNPRDERSFLYEPTTELLATLGVSRVQELPEYADITEKLSKLETAYREKSHE
jgi:segregation and condensation protein B